MASYLIAAGIFLTLGAAGFFYMVVSDVLDMVEPIAASMGGSSNPDTDMVRDIILLGVRLSPMWVFIGIILYVYSRVQKPEIPY